MAFPRRNSVSMSAHHASTNGGRPRHGTARPQRLHGATWAELLARRPAAASTALTRRRAASPMLGASASSARPHGATACPRVAAPAPQRPDRVRPRRTDDCRPAPDAAASSLHDAPTQRGGSPPSAAWPSMASGSASATTLLRERVPRSPRAVARHGLMALTAASTVVLVRPRPATCAGSPGSRQATAACPERRPRAAPASAHRSAGAASTMARAQHPSRRRAASPA